MPSWCTDRRLRVSLKVCSHVTRESGPKDATRTLASARAVAQVQRAPTLLFLQTECRAEAPLN